MYKNNLKTKKEINNWIYSTLSCYTDHEIIFNEKTNLFEVNFLQDIYTDKDITHFPFQINKAKHIHLETSQLTSLINFPREATKITIVGSAIKDLSDIKNSYIEELNLTSNRYLISIKDLPNNIKKITLCLLPITDISNLPNDLIELSITDCQNITDLSPLNNMKQLKTLNIQKLNIEHIHLSNINVSDMVFLSRLKNTKKITLYNCSFETIRSTFNKELTSINLDKTVFKHNIEFSNNSKLSEIQNIQNHIYGDLNISNCDFKNLYFLPEKIDGGFRADNNFSLHSFKSPLRSCQSFFAQYSDASDFNEIEISTSTLNLSYSPITKFEPHENLSVTHIIHNNLPTKEADLKKLRAKYQQKILQSTNNKTNNAKRKLKI